MASRIPSQTLSPRRADDRHARPAAPVALMRRILAAVAATHRARLRFEAARSFASARTRVSPEPEHALSWRFGVPVR
ncbi:hypothetical protein [Methylobacterium oryzisoli]|uniref:hypothetical protein n=1 Tax=Methylobacterium oryzisoli TaxID=3385502 RepID=UPI0038920D7D